MRAQISVAAGLTLLVGCATVHRSVLTDKYLENPVPKEDVQVFMADDSIPEHERVAFLSGEGRVTMAHIVDRLRAQAGVLGANAIILRKVRDPSLGEDLLFRLLTGEDDPPEREADAIAIYCPSLDPRAKDRP